MNTNGRQHFAKEHVELIGDATLSAEQAIVETQMKDGSVVSAHCKASKGSPENPLTRAEIEDKFRKAAGDRLARSDIATVLDMLRPLEDLNSVGVMMNALRTRV